LYWRVTNDNDVDVAFTWNGPGDEDGAGVATAASRTYFTTQDAGGANTTIINWDNPADGPDSKTKAHSNADCVYHVDFAKAWNGDAAPDLDGAVLFTATSSLGTAECTSDDGALSCTYPNDGADLEVPFGETYSVTEVAVDGWTTTAGTGNGFTGIEGFDEGALPDELVYVVADDRFCINDGQQLEKYCTHTLINTVDVPETTTTTTTEPEPEPEPTIEFSALAPVCIGDFPYVSYSVVGDGIDPDALVTLSFFFDPNEDPVATYADQPLEGSVLWPGASEMPPDWPGWEEAADGSWIPDTVTEENLWREQGLLVVASVNPTVSDTVGYPDQTDACDTPRGVLGSGTTTTSTVAPAPTVPPTPTVPPGGGLPETGSSSMPIALIALALLGGGLGLVVLARRTATIR
ncbi:MAG: LPXTG cell wall anchor domain-containing protein, partial [Actinomycetota bacterium]